jgi:hypothetical protein
LPPPPRITSASSAGVTAPMPGRRWADTQRVPRAGKRHNLAWAILVLGVLAASTLLSIHLYVMPLQVAAVYLRPAFVVVTSEPQGADVWVDGRKILGTTPAEVEVRRDHAEHTVEVHKEGFVPGHRALRYDREVRLEASFKLMPEPRFRAR